MVAPTIAWFRRDLRVHDHAPLSEAAQRGGPMVPLLTLDPALNPPPETGASRVAFLLTSLRALDRDLRRRDARLMVLRGDPASLLGAVARRLRPEAVMAHSNSERVLGRVRDACASQQLRNQGVRMRWFDPPASTDELLRQDRWRHLWLSAMRVHPCWGAPGRLQLPPLPPGTSAISLGSRPGAPSPPLPSSVCTTPVVPCLKRARMQPGPCCSTLLEGGAAKT